MAARRTAAQAVSWCDENTRSNPRHRGNRTSCQRRVSRSRLNDSRARSCTLQLQLFLRGEAHAEAPIALVVVVRVVGCRRHCRRRLWNGRGRRHRRDPIQSGLTASQSFLVSFSGGGIPANASSLVTAAGGTIVARYNMVGAVLARSSSASFATKLRAHRGRRGRRQRCRRAQRAPRAGHEHREARAAQAAPGRRQSALAPPVGHGSDPRAAGARDHGREVVRAGRPPRFGRRHHAPRSRGPRRRERQRLLRGRRRRPVAGALGERRVRARDVHAPASSAPPRTTSASSASLRA